MHVGDKPVDSHFQQHHQSTAYILPYLGVIIHSQGKEVLQRRQSQPQQGFPAFALLTPGPVAYLDEGVNIVHQRLGPIHDELVHTGDGMGPGRDQASGSSLPHLPQVPCRLLGGPHLPDLGATVLKELQELGNHDVEGPVESITIQELRRVFADLLQGSKGSLSGEEHTWAWVLVQPRLLHGWAIACRLPHTCCNPLS